MQSSTPVTAMIRFQVPRNERERWIAIWQELRRQAVRQRHCRQFDVLGDRCDETNYVIVSCWDRAADLAEFMRGAGVTWLDRGLDGTSAPPEYAVFEAVPQMRELDDVGPAAGHERATVVERELVPSAGASRPDTSAMPA